MDISIFNPWQYSRTVIYPYIRDTSTHQFIYMPHHLLPHPVCPLLSFNHHASIVIHDLSEVYRFTLLSTQGSLSPFQSMINALYWLLDIYPITGHSIGLVIFVLKD